MDKQEAENQVSWIGARLREPSTYVGLAAILAAIHIADAQTWTNIIMSLGIGIGGLIGMFLPERH
jgi:hypothetical protein